MKLSLGFSPCPNDTFIFDALVHSKIDTKGIEFEVIMADVEELNQLAFANKLDITKLSFHAYTYLTKGYILLNAGSALGFNCGPLLISKNEKLNITKETSIAIPGKYTTANFLLSLAYPTAQNNKELLFNEIENAVLNDEVEAGLIIHENRFTYQEKGLKKVIDLGEWWQAKTSNPIPLGGIVMHRKHEIELIQRVSDLIAESVQYAFQNPSSSKGFIKKHAQEMEDSVMQQHIDLYVNQYSVDLGKKGKDAVNTLFKKGNELGVTETLSEKIFL